MYGMRREDQSEQSEEAGSIWMIMSVRERVQMRYVDSRWIGVETGTDIRVSRGQG